MGDVAVVVLDLLDLVGVGVVALLVHVLEGRVVRDTDQAILGLVQGLSGKDGQSMQTLAEDWMELRLFSVISYAVLAQLGDCLGECPLPLSWPR